MLQFYSLNVILPDNTKLSAEPVLIYHEYQVPWHSYEGIIIRPEYTNKSTKIESYVFNITSLFELRFRYFTLAGGYADSWLPKG